MTLVTAPLLVLGSCRYYEVSPEAAALAARGAGLVWVDPGANEGSYAQLFAAFEATRGRYDRWVNAPRRWVFACRVSRKVLCGLVSAFP